MCYYGSQTYAIKAPHLCSYTMLFFSKRQEGRFLGVRTVSGNNFIGSILGIQTTGSTTKLEPIYDRSYPHYELMKIMFLQ